MLLRTDVPPQSTSPATNGTSTPGAAIGKRYVDEDDTVELLCTKPGEGVPALGGRPLTIKEAKPLPASD